jgi:hypothetical protein
VKSQKVARHLDAHLLEKLEIWHFKKGPTKPCEKKVPAGKSHVAETSSEEENSNELESDVQEVEDDSDKQEEEEDSDKQEEDSDDRPSDPPERGPGWCRNPMFLRLRTSLGLVGARLVSCT